MADLKVKVTPRASRSKIVWGETVKVYVTSPPVDGEANEAVVEVVAKALGIAKSRVDIVQGTTGRLKTLRVTGMGESEIAEKLAGRG